MPASDPIDGLGYKPGWRFRRGGPNNRYLCVYAHTPDSWRPWRMRFTQHQFEIPDGLDDWPAWVLERLLEIERHEACEFLQVDGRRPFYPNHQDEGSPYELVDRRTV
jgi:hypothetical protein